MVLAIVADASCDLLQLMFFASIGDVKRCSILVQTAQQLYGTEVRRHPLRDVLGSTQSIISHWSNVVL